MNQENQSIDDNNIEISKKLDILSEELHKENKPKSYFIRWIDNIDLDPKVKNLLKEMLKITGKIGGKLYEIGKIILKFLIKITEEFPNTVFASVIAFTLGAIIKFIPVIGPLISPVVAPILNLIVISSALLIDMRNKILTTVKTTF